MIFLPCAPFDIGVIMKRRFVTLDVFTDRRFAGNPVAIVLESEGLDTAAMQAIATEFNLSETVFVRPPEQPAHRARYRIFTPKEEVAFAGHPTIGTAILLGMLDGGSGPRDMMLDANIGPVPCHVAPTDAGGQASFKLPAQPKEVGPPPPLADLAAALGIAVDDIGAGAYQPACFSSGIAFIFTPVKSLDVVRRATPDLARFSSALSAPTHRAVFVYCPKAVEPGHDFHARMFAPSYGVVEDPATGSAAAAFTAVLARFGGLKDGEHNMTIEQGYEMGRPSVINVGLTVQGGALTASSVGGSAVAVSEGTIEA